MSEIEQTSTSNTIELVVYKLRDDYYNIVCKIIEKSYAINKKCLLLCNSEEEVDLFDSKLWTYSKLSFIPHGSKYSMSTDSAIHCNTWISNNLVYVNNPNYLINLGLNDNVKYNIPQCDIKLLEKIIHITCNVNDNLDTIKNKYNVNFYKSTLWIQENNKWVKSN